MGNLTESGTLEDIQTSVTQYVITKTKRNGGFQCYNIREAQQLCQCRQVIHCQMALCSCRPSLCL